MFVKSPASTGDYLFSLVITFLMQNSSLLSNASMYKINSLSKLKYATISIITNLAFIASKAFCLADVYSNNTGLPFFFD